VSRVVLRQQTPVRARRATTHNPARKALLDGETLVDLVRAQILGDLDKAVHGDPKNRDVQLRAALNDAGRRASRHQRRVTRIRGSSRRTSSPAGPVPRDPGETAAGHAHRVRRLVDALTEVSTTTLARGRLPLRRSVGLSQ
jgi:hypothetical protein